MSDRGSIGVGAPIGGSAGAGSGGVSYVGLVLAVQCSAVHLFTTPAGQAAGRPLTGFPSLAAQLTGAVTPASPLSGALLQPAAVVGTVIQPPHVGS